MALPAGVEVLLVEIEVDILGLEFVKGGGKVLKAATKAVHGLRGDHVELLAGHVLEQLIEPTASIRSIEPNVAAAGVI